MATMSASQARARLPEILNRVAAGEEITITRHDEPVAVVLAPGSLRGRRTAAAEAIERGRAIGRQIDAARHEPLRPTGAISPQLGEQWIRELRELRDDN